MYLFPFRVVWSMYLENFVQIIRVCDMKMTRSKWDAEYCFWILYFIRFYFVLMNENISISGWLISIEEYPLVSFYIWVLLVLKMLENEKNSVEMCMFCMFIYEFVCPFPLLHVFMVHIKPFLKHRHSHAQHLGTWIWNRKYNILRSFAWSNERIHLCVCVCLHARKEQVSNKQNKQIESARVCVRTTNWPEVTDLKEESNEIWENYRATDNKWIGRTSGWMGSFDVQKTVDYLCFAKTKLRSENECIRTGKAHM